jgi:hypothetical protein
MTRQSFVLIADTSFRTWATALQAQWNSRRRLGCIEPNAIRGGPRTVLWLVTTMMSSRFRIDSSGRSRLGALLVIALLVLYACSDQTSRTSTPGVHTAPSTLTASPNQVGVFIPKSPPNGEYSVLLPQGWRLVSRDGRIDGYIDRWSDPADPHRMLEVTRSRCSGCIRNQTNKTHALDPRAVLGSHASVSRRAPDRFAFARHSADNPYPDSGLLIVLPSGYAQVDLWLPKTDHHTATAILNSFRALDP